MHWSICKLGFKHTLNPSKVVGTHLSCRGPLKNTMYMHKSPACIQMENYARKKEETIKETRSQKTFKNNIESIKKVIERFQMWIAPFGHAATHFAAPGRPLSCNRSTDSDTSVDGLCFGVVNRKWPVSWPKLVVRWSVWGVRCLRCPSLSKSVSFASKDLSTNFQYI